MILGERDRGSCIGMAWCPAAAAMLVVGAWACAAEPPSVTTEEDGAGTQLVLLGTGTPNADPDRSGPSVAVIANGTAYLVDAGPGVVRRAAAAAAGGLSALRPRYLERVFITHLHSDHTVGLPDLMLTPWVLERERPLDVYGPVGVAAMTDHLAAAYDEDIRRRIEGLQPQNASGYRVTAHEIAPGIVFRDSNVVVTAFAVEHEGWSQAYGYRFETADRVVVISGDTRPVETVVTACNGCDVLVHEVYSDAGFAGREPEWQRYHARAHTSASELGSIARRARPKLLVLYHQLLWGSTPEELMAEIRGGYLGPLAYGNDLDVF